MWTSTGSEGAALRKVKTFCGGKGGGGGSGGCGGGTTAPPLPLPLALPLLLLMLIAASASRIPGLVACVVKGVALSPREQRGAAAVAELGRGRAVGGGGGAAGLLALASPPPPSRAAAPVHSCAERPASCARPSSPDECAL
jgi:hypothetical protein